MIEHVAPIKAAFSDMTLPNPVHIVHLNRVSFMNVTESSVINLNPLIYGNYMVTKIIELYQVILGILNAKSMKLSIISIYISSSILIFYYAFDRHKEISFVVYTNTVYDILKQEEKLERDVEDIKEKDLDKFTILCKEKGVLYFINNKLDEVPRVDILEACKKISNLRK